MRPTAGETGARVDPPHVLVLAPADRISAGGLLARLGREVRLSVLAARGPLLGLAPIDVAVLHVDDLGLACGPLVSDQSLGLPELVFVVAESGDPQELALRSRGFRHVVAEAELQEWLFARLGQLVLLARARRIVLSGCLEEPEAIQLPAMLPRASRMKLHVAETAFRTAYMRALLAEKGSRRRAAEEAGVPYRSFCEMLRKLGI